MNHSRKFDAEIALEMAGHLSWTHPIEVHVGVNTDWQLLKTNILIIDEYSVPTKRFNPVWMPPGLRLELITLRSPRLIFGQSNTIVRLSLTTVTMS